MYIAWFDKIQALYYNVIQREVVIMSTISLRLNDRDDELVRKFAAIHNVSVSELIRNAIIEKIEDEIDVELFDKAVAETQAVYTLDETKKKLGL